MAAKTNTQEGANVNLSMMQSADLQPNASSHLPPADAGTSKQTPPSDLQLILSRMDGLFKGKDFATSVVHAMKPMMDQITAEYKTVTASVDQHDRRLSALEATVKSQKETIDKLSSLQFSKEKHERLKNIRVTGLFCHKNEVHRVIAQLIAENMGIGDIELGEYTCRVIPSKHHREAVLRREYPTPAEQQEDTRNPAPPTHPLTVIVTFNNPWRKREVMGRRGYLRGTDVFFSEDLPKTESYLLYECRQLRRQKLISNCYSRDLTVYVKTLQGVEIPIKSESDLTSLKPQLSAPVTHPSREQHPSLTQQNGPTAIQPVITAQPATTPQPAVIPQPATPAQPTSIPQDITAPLHHAEATVSLPGVSTATNNTSNNHHHDADSSESDFHSSGSIDHSDSDMSFDEALAQREEDLKRKVKKAKETKRKPNASQAKPE